MMPDDDTIDSECERLISGDTPGEIPELPGQTQVSPTDIDLQFISIELANVASTLSSIYATINAQIAGILGEIRTDLRTIQEFLRESVRETLRETESCCLDIRRELALAVTFEIQSLYEQLAQFGIHPPDESPLAQLTQPTPEIAGEQRPEPTGATVSGADEEDTGPPKEEPLTPEEVKECMTFPLDYDCIKNALAFLEVNAPEKPPIPEPFQGIESVP